MLVAGLVGAQAAWAAPAGGSITVGPHAMPVRAVATRAAAAPLTSANLTYHGGPVMQAKSLTYAIFWTPPKLQTGAATHVSPTYQSLIERYLQDVGGSGLYNVNTQYYQVVNGTKQKILNVSTWKGSWVDTSPYPASGCTDTATPGNCLTDTQIQAEVRKARTANGWGAGKTRMFFVFTSSGEGSCLGADGSSCAFTQYCAYHGSFRSGGTTVLYANMPYTGTKPAACGVPVSPNGDMDADSTINVASHEHMEAVTDPMLNAWYDPSGFENGDKCAWNFG
ncbi:MAG: hypothetical protein ACXVYV_05185, partial [Gaiellales bacterium]